MSKAIFIPGEAQITKAPGKVVLELSQHEAEVLALLFRHVGGDGATTLRGVVAGVSDSLYDAGIRADRFRDGGGSTTHCFERGRDSIYFVK